MPPKTERATTKGAPLVPPSGATPPSGPPGIPPSLQCLCGETLDAAKFLIHARCCAMTLEATWRTPRQLALLSQGPGEDEELQASLELGVRQARGLAATAEAFWENRWTTCERNQSRADHIELRGDALHALQALRGQRGAKRGRGGDQLGGGGESEAAGVRESFLFDLYLQGVKRPFPGVTLTSLSRAQAATDSEWRSQPPRCSPGPLFLDSERQLMLGRERSGECFDPETGEILDLFTPRGSFLFDRNNRLVLNTSSRLESSTPKQRRQAAKLAAGMLAGPEQSEAPGSEESCLVVGEGTTCNSSAAAARAMKRIFQSPAPITHSFY